MCVKDFAVFSGKCFTVSKGRHWDTVSSCCCEMITGSCSCFVCCRLVITVADRLSLEASQRVKTVIDEIRSDIYIFFHVEEVVNMICLSVCLKNPLF